ncbi:right-handed parallel beta-helix repeat-containing protein [Micromonospora musae]|uniref:right-handed parallel beta-helix repeat-containing protein n=1 Tax=Micromonospora musae TaxID=1894970 RepID=UPI0033F566C5
MSNHLPEDEIVSQAATRPGAPGRIRWARWLVAGLTGVAGLAAVSGAAVATGGSVPDELGSLGNAAKQLITEGGRTTGDDSGGQDPGSRSGAEEPGRNDGKDHQGDERAVPCDADELIVALVRANAGNGATLKLAERCTYTLTAFAPLPTPPTANGPNGLPVITKPITIKGEGATIVRAASATPFRILEVGVGGDLTLRDLTIKGGSATTFAGGGGIRVDSGGKANLEGTDVVYNESSGPGGGIANFGITKIIGKADRGGAAAPSAEKTGPGQKPDGEDKDKYEGNEGEISDNVGVVDGGGVHNNGFLTMENTSVRNNHVRGTGGILLTGSGGGVSNGRVALLDGVSIHHNTADFRGGGVRGGNASTTQIKNSEISDNTASSEGGGIFSDGDLHLEHSEVNHNTVGQRGGGIFNQIGQLVIEHSKITENTVRNEHGGGIYVGSGTVAVRWSQVDRNKAVGVTSQAGGIFNHGTLSLTESTVTRNVATLAPGGVFTNNNLVTVDQNTVIIKNRPTNCTGSDQPVPNCFG